jgi:acyl-CoA reductase-like NAD-dependent aldehyde dehydrogenase
LRRVLIEECGSVFSKALREIEYVIDALRAAAGDARHVMGETMPMTMPRRLSMSVRKPLGVIAGIAPFNSPFLRSMKKISVRANAASSIASSRTRPRKARRSSRVETTGNFYRPTVLTDVTTDMRIYHEESFGPVVSLIKAADPEEALRIANDTDYGLSAAVITNDMQRALGFSLRLESGMVHVNDTTILDEPDVPFGGVKNSGFGREAGRYSLEELTEVKWVAFQTGNRRFPF